MSNDLFPPFFKWSDLKSKDEKKPDIVRIRVTELETWESEYTENINADVKQKNGEFIEMTIPLKSHNSKNTGLLDQWNKGIKANRIHVGDNITIPTYMGKSTKSDHDMRRWRLIKE